MPCPYKKPAVTKISLVRKGLKDKHLQSLQNPLVEYPPDGRACCHVKPLLEVLGLPWPSRRGTEPGNLVLQGDFWSSVLAFQGDSSQHFTLGQLLSAEGLGKSGSTSGKGAAGGEGVKEDPRTSNVLALKPIYVIFHT